MYVLYVECILWEFGKVMVSQYTDHPVPYRERAMGIIITWATLYWYWKLHSQLSMYIPQFLTIFTRSGYDMVHTGSRVHDGQRMSSYSNSVYQKILVWGILQRRYSPEGLRVWGDVSSAVVVLYSRTHGRFMFTSVVVPWQSYVGMVFVHNIFIYGIR